MKDELLITNVKLMRLSISEKLVMVNQLEGSRAVSLAYTRLEEAFMFLGKILGALGDGYPYPGDDDKEKVNKKISDSCDPDSVVMPEGSPIKKVKDIRGGVQVMISSRVWNYLLDRFSVPGQPFVRYSNISWTIVNQSLMHLMAAKMWLGMELNNLSLGSSEEANYGDEVKVVGEKEEGVGDKEQGTEKPAEEHDEKQGAAAPASERAEKAKPVKAAPAAKSGAKGKPAAKNK